MRTVTSLFLITCLVATAAAAEDGAGDTRPAKVPQEATAATHDQVQGSWRFDVAAMLDDQDVDQKDPMAAKMVEAMKQMLGQARIEIDADSMVATMRGQENEAAYTIAENDGETVLTMTESAKEEGAEPKTREVRAYVQDGTLYLVEIGEQDVMILISTVAEEGSEAAE